MSMLDLDALHATRLEREPFDHCVLPAFVRPEAMAAVQRDFPRIDRPGSFPAAALDYGPAFARLLDELQGPELTDIMSEKFATDLASRPTMVTVRGQCRARDGQIHTDSRGKIITVLIYMNAAWEADGGRLRLLRSRDDIEDYAAEVPPREGSMVAFRCTEDAWHGHKPYEGSRRSIQLNWVVDGAYLRKEQRRHRLSAFLKKLTAAA